MVEKKSDEEEEGEKKYSQKKPSQTCSKIILHTYYVESAKSIEMTQQKFIMGVQNEQDLPEVSNLKLVST